jgi:hypothetical protein
MGWCMGGALLPTLLCSQQHQMCLFKYIQVFFRELTNQLNRFKKSTRASTVEVPLIAIRKAENVWSSRFFRVGAGRL